MEGLENIDITPMFDRTSIVIGKKNVKKLKNMNICICGIGGVGSYVLEAILRLGVEKITVIDKDKVDSTNINRQLVASWYTVGMPKVEVANIHAQTINPNAKVIAIQDYIDAVNVDKYISDEFDYVIDAIDSISSKLAIINRCKSLNIPIISSMGMGNKLDPLKIKVGDISKTNTCPLARIIRKRLKEMNITNVKVVYSEEEALKTNNKTLGSMPYVPAVAGLVIVSEIVKEIIKPA